MKKGILTVISGPSGAGKGTVIAELLKENHIELSVSCTTRAPRGEEKEGVNYFFKNTAEFEKMIVNAEFVEYAQVFGKYYGTPKKYVMDKLNAGKDVILEIDVQGAMQVKGNYDDAVLIFIAPPTLHELLNRLEGRGTETKELIKKRFNMAKSEINYARRYDYVVVNDRVEDCAARIKGILDSSKLAAKHAQIIDELLNEGVEVK